MSQTGPWGRRIAAALLACLLIACSPATEDIAARPAMWLVQDDDTRLYLLGTMHALPRGTDWDDGKVADAIDAADELMMELSPDELANAGAEFQRLAPRAAPLPMDQRLSALALAKYRTLEASGTGQSFGGDTLDDWAVTLAMAQRVAQNAALVPAAGVENGLTARFRAKGKPIGGLETARQQILLFEKLDAGTQRRLLTTAAAGIDDAETEVKAMAAAWSRGDVAALEAQINDDIDAVPAARQSIMTDRNRRWSDWAVKRMAKPGAVLVAVGAGHMVGSDGLPALLKARGLQVERVQ